MRQQLLESLYKDFDYQETLSDTSSENKKIAVEMKDEEIQALDEEIDSYIKNTETETENQQEE